MEEALEIAQKIRAKFAILTHFSQRYPKNLSHDQGKKEQDSTTLEERAGACISLLKQWFVDQQFICAHDLMTVDFSILHHLCTIRDSFENCFFDDDEWKG